MNLIKNNRLTILTIISASVLISWIYFNAPKPQEKSLATKAPKISYSLLIERNQAIPVFTRGRVTAAEIRQITNEVPGLVTQVSENLKKGSNVKQGDLLIQLDEQPYILEIALKQADLDRVRLDFVRATAQATVAKNGLQNNATEYAQHIPQVRFASSQVAAAEAALSYAKKKLEKTKIVSPIDGKVVDLMITEGQFINATSSIAKIYGTQMVEVRLPLNDQQIDLLSLAGKINLNSKGETLPKVVLSNYQSKDRRWQGVISRAEGERDNNQLVYAIAQVASDDPFNQQQKPLLPGSFVEAKIEGKPINNLQIIPRHAEQAANTVWVIDESNKLRRKIIEIIYRGKTETYVKAGLNKNDRIVTGSFALMAEGLAVQPHLAADELGLDTRSSAANN